MGTGAKIQLSTFETELVKNKEWILTKHAIIDKVYKIFGEMNETYKQVSEQQKSFLQEVCKNAGGKISKGENYEGLPYVILDYPALFSRESIFAVRTLFWWGNFFSITLHLSGERFKIKGDFLKMLSYLQLHKFYVCVNEKEWHHHFELSNYVMAKELDRVKLEQISNRDFFKISKNLELDKWNEAPEFLNKSFSEIIGFINISFPAGGKVLSPGFPKADSGL